MLSYLIYQLNQNLLVDYRHSKNVDTRIFISDKGRHDISCIKLVLFEKKNKNLFNLEFSDSESNKK